MPATPEPPGGAGDQDAGTFAENLAENEARAHLQGSTLLLSGRLLSLVVGFLTQVLIVRSLSAAGFGAFAYALSWVMLGQLICGLGLQRSVGLFLGRYDHEGDDARILGLLRLVLIVIGVSGMLLIGAVLAGQALTGGGLLDERLASSLLAILIVLAPLQAADDLLSGMLAFLGTARAIFVRQHILEPGLKLAVVLLLVGTDSGVRALAVGYVAATVVGLGVYLFALRSALDQRGLRERMRGVKAVTPWRQVMVYTLPLLSTDLVTVCFSSIDAVLLGHYRDATAVGALRVVQPLVALNVVVFTSFTLLYLPAASRLHARGDLAGLRDLYWRTTTWIAVLTFPVLAVTTVLARPVTELLFGARYAGSGTYLALLAIGTYVTAAAGFNGLTIRVFGFLRFTLAINAAAILGNLALALVLIPEYGAKGAALATAASLVLHNVLKQLGLRRCLGSAFPPSPYRQAFLVLLLAGAALGATRWAFGEDLLPCLAAAVLTSAAVALFSLRSLELGSTFPALAPLLSRLPHR